MIPPLLLAVIIVFSLFLLTAVVAIVEKNNSVVDSVWGVGFVLVAWALLLTTTVTVTKLFVAVMVTIWGVRLSLHITKRNKGKGEDWRYAKWRTEWGKHWLINSIVRVFLLQAVLQLLVATPIIIIMSQSHDAMTAWTVFGVLIWTKGFFWQSVGDNQLRAFVQNPKNKGKILQSGLWRYSRHPNYWGEAQMWLGLAVIGSQFSVLAFLGAFTIIFILVKVSIPLLESKYAQNKEFQAYKQRTSALVGLPPRQNI